MIQGRHYTLRFDARAETPRVIEVKLLKTGSTYTEYAQIGFVYVMPQKTRQQYNFTMSSPTDSHARLTFRCGYFTGDFYLDNVSLISK